MKNSHLFDKEHYSGTYLRARGFTAGGSRAGGIVDPKRVILHQQTVLIRLFTRYDGSAGYGDWWNTPHELVTAIDYLAVDGPSPGAGQSRQFNAMQALLVLLPCWNNDADTFHVIRLKDDMEAFHGEADMAAVGAQPATAQKANTPPKAGASRKVERLSPFLITDRSGRRRAARQLMIPEFRFSDFEILHIGAPLADLPSIARGFDSGPLSFER
jgi:hypothetical protein